MKDSGSNFKEAMTACEEAVEGWIELTADGQWVFNHSDITLPNEKCLVVRRDVFMASIMGPATELTEEEAEFIMNSD